MVQNFEEQLDLNVKFEDTQMEYFEKGYEAGILKGKELCGVFGNGLGGKKEYTYVIFLRCPKTSKVQHGTFSVEHDGFMDWSKLFALLSSSKLEDKFNSGYTLISLQVVSVEDVEEVTSSFIIESLGGVDKVSKWFKDHKNVPYHSGYYLYAGSNSNIVVCNSKEYGVHACKVEDALKEVLEKQNDFS